MSGYNLGYTTLPTLQPTNIGYTMSDTNLNVPFSSDTDYNSIASLTLPSGVWLLYVKLALSVSTGSITFTSVYFTTDPGQHIQTRYTSSMTISFGNVGTYPVLESFAVYSSGTNATINVFLNSFYTGTNGNARYSVDFKATRIA